MFFILPIYWIIFIYFAAALLPAIWLMRYIYDQDKIEKEPSDLLWKCVWRGVLAALCSIVLEMIGENVLNVSQINKNTLTYVMLLAFLVVAVVEEGMKYLLMAQLTWKNPNFNYRFDAIVYSAFTSLGFAAFENVKYVFSYGLTVAFPRAILSIPAHLGFSVVFGYFYGRAKLYADENRRGKSILNIVAGYILAVLLHGFYDTCAMLQTGIATIIFVAFVVVMYIVIIRLIRHESWTDGPV